MQLRAALFLLASCAFPAVAIYKDEVNHIDYHHSLLGVPLPKSTFFLKPSSASNASLLYTLSENLILGAVNPRDGSTIWRQNLSQLALGNTKGPDTAMGFLRAFDGASAVVSAAGGYVASWSASDGRLIWESWFEEPVADLEMLFLADGNAEKQAPGDAITLFGGKSGTVKRLDGESGNIKWEFKDDSGDTPFQLSSSSTEIYYVSLQNGSGKGPKLKVTTLNPVSGRQLRQYVLNPESDVAVPQSVLPVSANAAVPLIAWVDRPMKTLRVNVLGSKQVQSVSIENDSNEDIRSIKLHASSKFNSLPHLLVQYETDSSSWAEVYRIDLKSGAVSKVYQLPLVKGQSVFAASTNDASAYFVRMTESEITVVSPTSYSTLGRWALKSPLTERALHAAAEVVTRADTVAIRAATLFESGDWQLARNGQVEWTRHEALTGAMAASWVEEADEEDLAHQLEFEGHGSPYVTYVHRIKRHVKDLEQLPGWLKELPKRILSSFLADEVSNLDHFGVSKSVIVATANGRVFALDGGNHGSVSWSVKAAETDRWNVKAIISRPGFTTVYADDGSTVTLNVSSGDIVGRTPPDTKVHSVAVIDDISLSTVAIKDDGTPVKPTSGSGFLVTASDDGRIFGWDTRDNQTPIWQFRPPHGEKIVGATARPSHDTTASIGKVLGDRSVLYKYLNPNLLLLTAVGETSASFYLLDGVSGKILHASTQTGVDTTQPVPSAISENWFAYSFWAEANDPSGPKGYQLVISELYESSAPNDRGRLGAAANYSSILGDALPEPFVLSQSFVIPEPISHMAVTQTRQGITVKQLICALPASNAIVGIPRPVLDPRRPVGRDPTSGEAEEGLFRYSPSLVFDGMWYLTHMREVAGITNILSSPTLLESTSLVFAFGGDIFMTRVTPSHAFDVLGKSFSKFQLLLTVVALIVGVVMLKPMVLKKQASMRWNS